MNSLFSPIQTPPPHTSNAKSTAPQPTFPNDTVSAHIPQGQAIQPVQNGVVTHTRPIQAHMQVISFPWRHHHAANPPPPKVAPHGQAAQFQKGSLSRQDLQSSPALQFTQWFDEAAAHPIPQHEACAMATAELPSGRVSNRIVYLKELDARGGFVVYSNWGMSRKAADLQTNKHVALVFHWGELQRQVRVEGVGERCDAHGDQVYFRTRARGSKIGAWASRQSEVLADGREGLERSVKEVEERFAGVEDIPVPEFWGGLRIVPSRVEFWQGRDSRLHDRFVYERGEGRDGQDDEWEVQRLSP